MALFNDGPLSAIADLMNYETSILDVASTEGIDTATKMQLAQDEISAELLAFLLQSEDRAWLDWLDLTRRRELGVGDVVVTIPLRRWHTFRTLAMIFRDAYNNQLNDRYQGKWKNYEQLQSEAARAYLQIGAGLVARPAPKPAAPTVNTTPGPSAAGTYYVAISWVTVSGSEGACSDPARIELTDAVQAIVSCGAPPRGISGWNLYAGTTADELSLQNGRPLAIGDHVVQAMPPASGQAPGGGQAPEYWVVDQHRLRRG